MMLRDIVRVWLATQGLIPFEVVQDAWESPLRPEPESPEGWPTEQQAWRMLGAALNSGLAEVPARLTMQMSGETALEASDRPVASRAFSALCIQFANDIAEGVTYHQCQNEKCGVWFVHQTGRSVSGRNRTQGVQYCSVQCARAVAQRDHYRRRKASGGAV